MARFFDRLSAIEVTVDLGHPVQRTVDLKVSAEHKHDFVATSQSEDLMGSIDQVIHKLEQQLRKYKKKIQTRHRGPGSRQQGAPHDSDRGSQ